MIVYYDGSGKILSAIAASSQNIKPPLNTGTPLYLDDAQHADVWNNPQNYTIQNGTPVSTPVPASVQLANAQSAQITQLRVGYTQTLASGFNATIGSTQYTFGWSTDDKANMLAVQEAVTDGLLTFPISYSDIHGSPVSITDQTTLTSIKSKATSFFANQHQQILNLVGQVQAAATVSQVQAIVWTPATY